MQRVSWGIGFSFSFGDWGSVLAAYNSRAMEAETKFYIRFLLTYTRELFTQNVGMSTLLKTHPDARTRETWEAHLKELLEQPEVKQEIAAKFDPHLDKIMKALEDSEAFAALLRTPTKGLPN